MTDDQIIDAVRNGDSEIFRLIVDRYEQRIAATVIGMLGNCPEAEDIGQETFIRFYRTIGSFRGEASLGTYLTRIAINLSKNALKRRQRLRGRLADSEGKDISSALGHTPELYNETREIVDAALKRLDGKFRTVIVLRYVNGYSVRETAEILRIPAGTVLSRQARGERKLKELLAPYYRSRT